MYWLVARATKATQPGGSGDPPEPRGTERDLPRSSLSLLRVPLKCALLRCVCVVWCGVVWWRKCKDTYSSVCEREARTQVTSQAGAAPRRPPHPAVRGSPGPVATSRTPSIFLLFSFVDKWEKYDRPRSQTLTRFQILRSLSWKFGRCANRTTLSTMSASVFESLSFKDKYDAIGKHRRTPFCQGYTRSSASSYFCVSFLRPHGPRFCVWGPS